MTSTEKSYPYLLILFAFVLYGNSLFNKYCFDDKLVTPIHPQVQEGLKGIPEIFLTNYTSGFTEEFEYRPLAKTTFAVEYQFFGKNPFVSHLINVLLYCLTVFFLYRITFSIFKEKGRIFAFLAILFFLVHPAHTEVVSSLKNREELLAFLFCLFSIIFFIKSAKERNYYFFIPALFFFILSLFTKLISLPFLLIIPMCMFYAGSNNFKIPVLAFFGISLSTLFFFLGLNFMLPGTHDREIFFIENAIIAENSFNVIFLNGLQTMWLYIKLYVWPHPLSFYYGFDVFPLAKKITPEIVISLTLHGFMLVYSLLKIRNRDLIAFAFLFYLLNMSMYYNIVFPTPGIIADRALYISSFGFSLLISHFAVKFPQRIIIFICVLIILPSSVKTFLRNRDWKDNFTLISKDIKHLKHSAKANLEYATLLRNFWENEKDPVKKEKFAEQAVFYFLESLKVNPYMAIPNNEIGKILFNHYHKENEAKEYFRKAVNLQDSKAEFHFNLATSYAFLGEFENAEKSFLKTIKLEPEHTRAIHNLYLVYMSQRKFNDAFQANSILLEKIPGDVYPYYNFGKYYLAVGDTLDAVKNFEKADDLRPGNKEIISILESLKK